MDNKEINQGRRRFLTLATAGAGAIAAAGVATPLAASWFPSEKAKAAGASIEVDVSKIEAGQLTIAEWRGKPIFVLHRTPAQLKDLPSLDSSLADPASTADQQPEYCKNPTRAIKENIWVSVPTWAARPLTAQMSARQIWAAAHGKAVSSAPATAPNSTWPAVSMQAFLHRPIWSFLHTNI